MTDRLVEILYFLAFVQGGKYGSRLVYLTPQITVKKWANNCEARWTPGEMPFKYKEAPLLVSNNGQSDFPSIRQFALPTDSRKIEGHFSSKIRSRTRPLEPKLAQEVVKVYERKRKKAPDSAVAATYDEALPWRPPKVDRSRKATYQSFIAQRQAESDGAGIISRGKGARRGTQSQSRCGRCGTGNQATERQLK